MKDFPRNHEERIIRRKTIEPVASVRRRVIVSLEPGDVISFREDGRRHTYVAPVGPLFMTAVKHNAWALKQEKAREKQLIRQGLS